VHSADGWCAVLEPVNGRYRGVSLDFVSWKDRKPVAAALKDIYRAVDAAAGEAALAAFDDGVWEAANIRQSARAGGAPGARSPRSMPFPAAADPVSNYEKSRTPLFVDSRTSFVKVNKSNKWMS